MTIDDRTVVGLTEVITIHGPHGSEKVLARIDTGATKSSISLTLASKLELGPVVDSKLVKSAHGSKLRPIINVNVDVKGKELDELFTLADRDHMKYKVLIGQNVLKHDFMVDPTINPGKEEWQEIKDSKQD
jgi:hypothetical protein